MTMHPEFFDKDYENMIRGCLLSIYNSPQQTEIILSRYCTYLSESLVGNAIENPEKAGIFPVPMRILIEAARDINPDLYYAVRNASCAIIITQLKASMGGFWTNDNELVYAVAEKLLQMRPPKEYARDYFRQFTLRNDLSEE